MATKLACRGSGGVAAKNFDRPILDEFSPRIPRQLGVSDDDRAFGAKSHGAIIRLSRHVLESLVHSSPIGIDARRSNSRASMPRLAARAGSSLGLIPYGKLSRFCCPIG